MPWHLQLLTVFLRGLPIFASPLSRWETEAWNGARPVLGRGKTEYRPRPLTRTPPVVQVRSKHCDVKTKFITHTPCTSCAVKKWMCPSGWLLQRFPDRASQNCRYRSHPILLASRNIL